MGHPVADTFAHAATLLAGDAARQGNCLIFQAGQEVFYTGDIHGHRQNLAKIIARADLTAHPDRRLVLQELIHGGPADPAGGDRSFELLMRAARLKAAHPDQVHLLMGNHDLAQFAGQEITKEGRGMCKAFQAGLAAAFGPAADEVNAAACALLRSLPLAARCPNGAFLSHSLPSPSRMDLIDWDILHRPYREGDYPRGGSLYEWTWGRGHTAEQLDDLAQRLDARLFLLGHQAIETGHEIHHGRLVILAANHPHGAIMIFDAGEPLAEADLPGHIHPVVAL